MASLRHERGLRLDFRLKSKQLHVMNYPLLIREHHLDTFGHVNNATYLEIFEEARWQLITDQGYDLDYIHKTGLGPIILEVQLKFMKELRLREEIIVKTEMLDYNGKIGQLKQQMIKKDGTIASEAVFKLALFDTRQRKIVLPTPEWKKAVGLT